MLTIISPGWDRFLGWSTDAASIPPRSTASIPWSATARWLYGISATDRPAARDGGATSGSAAPPARPRPPVDNRPLPPEPSQPPRRPLESAWLTWQMPAPIQEQAKAALRKTLEWRTKYCKPLDPPETPPDYTRFGLVGEQLTPKGGITVRKTLRAELREMVRTLEGAQSRTERNWLLAMHSIRLGQLCAELEHRGIDVLEEVRNGLAMLWA
ncbi:MAG TPA: hypothetical protein VFU32_00665 [Ktedonobacterales bacterium]|nr:hypothetical protein [Ktedonobacterales bacterium]